MAIFGLFSLSLSAQGLLLDTSTIPANPDSVGNGRTDGAISLKVESAADTVINVLEARLVTDAASNVRFLIATNNPNEIVFYSDPVAVDAGDVWVTSPTFEVTLIAGQRYEIAAMVEGTAVFPWHLDSITQNGLTALAENGNPENYISPTNLGDANLVTPHFRIYASVPLSPAAPVPTLPLAALGLLSGLAGLLGIRQLRKAA